MGLRAAMLSIPGPRRPSRSERSSMGVTIMLGGTALTVMPWRPSSTASERVKPKSAAFDEA
jgi:hypothetical protein